MTWGEPPTWQQAQLQALDSISAVQHQVMGLVIQWKLAFQYSIEHNGINSCVFQVAIHDECSCSMAKISTALMFTVDRHLILLDSSSVDSWK